MRHGINCRAHLSWFALCIITLMFTFSQAIAADWSDVFTHYSLGGPPDSLWTCTGNCSGVTVDSIDAGLGRSLKLFGVIGGTWSAAGVRQLGTCFPVSVECMVLNGTDNLVGNHQYRAGLMFKPGPNWSDRPGITVFDFMANGDLEVQFDDGSTIFPGFPLGQWHYVRVDIYTPGDLTLHASIWIDGVKIGDFARVWQPWMKNLSHLHLESGAGPAWFDNVSIKSLNPGSSGDVDRDATVDIADLTALIDNLYISLGPLPACPQ